MSIKINKKTKKKKVIKRLSPEEKIRLKEQRAQEKEIITILSNIGFVRIPGIEGKEVVFDGRSTEMDDIFFYENIVLIVEYTIGDPGTHLLKKKIFYDKINSDKRAFLNFLNTEPKLASFKSSYDKNINSKYSLNEIQVRILYASKKDIQIGHRALVDNVIFFDYHIVKYFSSLTKVIKKSSKYEFFDFIGVPFKNIADNIKSSSKKTSETFSGHILPEEKSSFEEGYKIVSFYIDAESLLRRSYVLRQNSWKQIENVGHYQRMLLPKKITAMRKYLVDKNRVFINNIITSISTDKIRLYDNEKNELKLLPNGQFKESHSSDVTPASIEINNESNIIGIIDGQHRTFAYHEGNDTYERVIATHRKIQNLLVTGILFPANESPEKRLKFEANLFLEINANQSNASSQLKQEIELMINPMSSIAISKRILLGLNKSGPLGNLIEQYWYEKGKLKTASIVSYGLRPLVKIEDIKAKDSIFSVWKNAEKGKLKRKDNEEFSLLTNYIEFSVEKIRDLLIAFKTKLQPEQWKTYSKSNPKGILSVTFINGVLNTLRLLIQHNKVATSQAYMKQLDGIDKFTFKKYKSSQYRKMGEDIYDKYFK
ncbi:MAG TPA: DGQHR domain-containing protein [Phnomibacter sp.]|nr:DGQHR domain-containing protein [Phnomibacter sp.]